MEPAMIEKRDAATKDAAEERPFSSSSTLRSQTLVEQFRKTRRQRRLIDDPERGATPYPLISVDDHFLEPRDTFEGRLPGRFADRVPKVVEDDDGVEMWRFEDANVYISGANAQSGFAKEDRTLGPVRFDELRPAIYDADARVRDMSVNGMLASLCFPSMVFGFCGQRFHTYKDPELGLALLRAYNDWVIEGWVGKHPTRLLACQIPWLPDPRIAAEEIRKNAQRGFTSVSFSENPECLGYPSLYTDHWDPFFRACEETGTVVNLHVGSSSRTTMPSSQSPIQVSTLLFPLNSFMASADWLFTGIPVRFPNLKIVMSESGIGFLPMLYDRLEYTMSRFFKDNDGGMVSTWPDNADVTPLEALRRNFWFTSFWDPRAFEHLDIIGSDRVMIEVDYPHPDSTWPDTQEAIGQQLGAYDPAWVAQILRQNASDVYRHEIPDFAVLQQT